MNRYLFKIAYLGSDFYGSQAQTGYKTVEGDVQENLRFVAKLPRDVLRLGFSSRTDRGVNALGNAITFHSDIPGDILLKALNSVSTSVFYMSYCEVGEDFNVRHASSRSYRYMLPKAGLDVGLVERCAELFVGTHDFIRFCRPDGKGTVLTINSVTVRESGDVLLIDFNARYFLWNMIRRIVAAMQAVGCGNSTLDDVRRALDGEDMTFGIARPDALTLLDVAYDWLEFTPANPKHYGDRKDAGLFSADLRRTFFESL